jgi:hypothetical protein
MQYAITGQQRQNPDKMNLKAKQKSNGSGVY